MNDYLKNHIGKYITIGVNFMYNGSQREEYVQGKLKDVKDDILIIDQYIPFSSIFNKESETVKLTREINIQRTIPETIKIF